MAPRRQEGARGASLFAGLPLGYMTVLVALFLVMPPVLYLLVLRGRR